MSTLNVMLDIQRWVQDNKECMQILEMTSPPTTMTNPLTTMTSPPTTMTSPPTTIPFWLNVSGSENDSHTVFGRQSNNKCDHYFSLKTNTLIFSKHLKTHSILSWRCVFSNGCLVSKDSLSNGSKLSEMGLFSKFWDTFTLTIDI